MQDKGPGTRSVYLAESKKEKLLPAGTSKYHHTPNWADPFAIWSTPRRFSAPFARPHRRRIAIRTPFSPLHAVLVTVGNGFGRCDSEPKAGGDASSPGVRSAILYALIVPLARSSMEGLRRALL